MELEEDGYKIIIRAYEVCPNKPTRDLNILESELFLHREDLKTLSPEGIKEVFSKHYESFCKQIKRAD